MTESTQAEASQYRVLWIDDDDDVSRFIFEEQLLQERQCQVDWVHCVKDAAEKLGFSDDKTPAKAPRAYDLILLDQEMPSQLEPSKDRSIWAGCRLLYWLKGKDDLWREHWARMDNDHWPYLDGFTPHEVFTHCPVCIVSVKADPQLYTAFKHIAPTIPAISKPIDEDEFLMVLGQLLIWKKIAPHE